MKQLLLGGAAFALAIGAGLSLPASVAEAQVMVTPPGCQWLDAGGGVQDLFCRDADGRAYRTDTRRRDMGGTMDVCVRGQLDDGMGCVSEAAARRSQAFSIQYDPMVNAPPPFDWKANKSSTGKWKDPSRPEGIIVQGGRHNDYRYGYVIDAPD
jgi:hypothetical protein